MRIKRGWLLGVGVVSATALIGAIYVFTHPLVFNESFFGHAHCIAIAGGTLRQYSVEHGGRFPSHTNGYADALVLLGGGVDFALTGPGYNTEVFKRVRRTGEDAPEVEFGRVYVQGLSETNDPSLVLLFDKHPTPGGDHCHLWHRLNAPLAREVVFIDGSHRTIRESAWPAFARSQVDLLVTAGIPRLQAQPFYDEAERTGR